MTTQTSRVIKNFISLLTIILCSSLLLTAVGAQSARAADPVFTTSDNGDDTVTITGCTDCPDDLVIPSAISGKSVTAIGTAAFFNGTLESVSIPDSVVSIGRLAFAGNWLSSLVLPNSVTSVGSGAFASNDLGYQGSVTLSNSLARIGTGAFAQNAFSSLTIPASVKYIGPSAFSNSFYTNGPTGVSELSLTFLGNAPELDAPILHNSGLSFITVPNDATGWGSTFSEIPVKFVSGSTPSTSASPYPNPTASVAFDYEVHKDNSTATITGCKANCGATNLVIPATVRDNVSNDTLNVTSIAFGAFAYNASQSVTIPNSVTSIGEYAFTSSRTTSVTLPTSITSISEGLFQHSALTSLTIPSSVTDIGNRAFGNNKIANLTIPSSVTNIDSGAFYLNSLTTLTIPKSVKTIGSWAFGANNLSQLTIPAPVNEIGASAFRSNNLTSVTFSGNAPTVGASVFDENPALRFVIVPLDATGFGATFAGLAVKSVPEYKSGTHIRGIPKVNKILTAKPGTWAGTAPFTYTYQWYSCKKSVRSVVKTGKVPSGCTAISGAIKSSFKLTAKQKKAFISALISADNGAKNVKVLTASVGAVK
ncbi:MAG: leucine-rich repeat domain-containing protein [Actinobacteria bacterium]|nr:leucine-rich repeat domain-containing protein [Actinomycetota bacterium]